MTNAVKEVLESIKDAADELKVTAPDRGAQEQFAIEETTRELSDIYKRVKRDLERKPIKGKTRLY